MIVAAFTAFVLGLRHGADPDHLAAIDNVTRNAYRRAPLLSRFVGTLFASGHAVMVLAISAIVGLLGARFAAQGSTIEIIGTWISIVVLLIIAYVNLRGLKNSDGRITGAKTRVLPSALRNSTNVLVAIPIGLLFGVGFETSSQILTYTAALSAGNGISGALIVGLLFCAGMIVTDTLDSVLVHRLVSSHSQAKPNAIRVWIVSVSALAIIVAGYELAQLLGWKTPFPDIFLSIAICLSLAGVFVYVFASTRRSAELTLEPKLSVSVGDGQ
jgi:high-affinity nickel-transport protein